MVSPLFKHQNQSVKFMRPRLRVLDFSDPGTGKTRVAIEDFGYRRGNHGGAALVLAPKTLLETAWADDIDEYGRGMDYSVAYAENRAEAFNRTADMYITNIDAVKWLAKQKASFFKRFESLYIDESTYYKHHASQRSKALKKVKRAFEYRRAMTGTPNPNGICDLWHQVLSIDDGHRLGNSYYHFRSSVCEPVQEGPAANMVRWHDREGAEIAVTALLKDITIRHIFEDCVDIPPNHLYSMSFSLPPKLRSVYAKLEKQSIVFLKNHRVTAVNGGVLYNKLLQVASGAVYSETGAHVDIASQRYELILDLVEAREFCVVLFFWTHQRNALAAEAKKRGISFAIIDGKTPTKNRKEIVKNYQSGFYKMLLAHPQTAGHGLTLVRGTTTIFASPTANAEWFSQAYKRIYRIGQTQKTETIVVVARNTRDESVYQSYQDKTLKMSLLLAELQHS